ncbi:MULTISPECIES: hypothetical protein [Bradyrhizobium]|nr:MULTISPECIES: hypothetical protein [Bradyrhizobium]
MDVQAAGRRRHFPSDGMEPIGRIIVVSAGLSKAGSISSRRTLALDFEFG